MEPFAPAADTPEQMQRLQSLVDWWAEQAASIERDRRNLLWILVATVPCVTVLWYKWDWRFALGGLGVGLLAYAQGMYLVTVHRWEYAFNLREARRDLWLARKKASEQSNGAVPPAPTDWGVIHCLSPVRPTEASAKE